LTFDVTKGWGGLKDQAKLFANPKIDVDLNKKWADFLLGDQSPKVQEALLNGIPNDLVKGAQFNISRKDKDITLSITILGQSIVRILTLNNDNQLVAIKSQFDTDTETIQLDGVQPSLSSNVKAGDAGIYFVGTYTNKNTACAKASAQYSTKTGNTTDSLKFTLTLSQDDVKEVPGTCILSSFRPTTEIYEFTLTSDGLKLNAVQATLSVGTLKLVF